MLNISINKIAQIVLMSREMGRAQAELSGFFETLTDEELTDLVAVMWIGRGSFEAEELVEARALAIAEATTPTPDYLMGTPHLSDHLENGLEALGLSASDDEDDLIRGG
ncbi:DUF3775 domain-containing protein [Lentibacter algarum]|uniref:DUF3775 domain-containing protein n=1 Tax=Lentibacter algarum TaxID=576131 RepID=UPI001C06EF50|nr:DUF3775 domain-containing protein [Lentibacter algarum]MBU2981624.1 DUF3775 domain-containing protein [Lentibacter algarum]